MTKPSHVTNPTPRTRAASLLRCAVLFAAALTACTTSGGDTEDGDGQAASPPETVGDAGAAGVTASAELTAAEREAGWQLLFDGRTLQGWRGLGRDSIPAAHWVVQDGMIRKVRSGDVPVQADGQPLEGGDIMTEATFRDFELTWEWRVMPGANSGVKYNVSEELSGQVPPIYAAIGFEYQILDDDRHEDAELPTHRAGALYDLIAPTAAKRLHAVGDWNQSRIVFRGNHGEHWLNAEKIVEYDLGTPRMDSLIAASKYSTIPWFGERRAGHIVLQDHGDEVFFRNIKIREF